MKFYNYVLLFLCFGILFSCKEEPEVHFDLCPNDFAQFLMNGELMQTTQSSAGGEFLTPEGASCGIAAAFDEENNYLILNIVVEDQHLNFHVDNVIPLEALAFSNVQYSYEGGVGTLDHLDSDFSNYIQINGIDAAAESIEGNFSFQMNHNGVLLSITEGSFRCNYHEI